MVGLYLDPPEHAVVLCMDEKSSVERWFRELTDRALRRGVFRSVPDLIEKIEEYLAAHNSKGIKFTWTATTDQILA